MAITPRLEIKQTQSLLMTPQLRQAIQLLQMSNLELNELVTQELENNPFLEREDDLIESYDDREQSIDDYKDENPQDKEIENYEIDTDYDNQTDDFGSDREGYGENSDYDWDNYAHSKNATNDGDFDFFEKKLSDEKTLLERLQEQIQMNFYKPYEKIIASNLIEHLDDAGYFVGNLQEISQRMNVNQEILDDILYVLKTFEPSGIFAQSLAECLTIQLKDKALLTKEMNMLLQNLELLGQGKAKELMDICQVDEKTLHTMVKEIRALNPKPTADYVSEKADYIIPDVFVKRGKYGEYNIELNHMSLPKVLINQNYKTFVSDKDKETNKYIKTQINSANFLVKALHQRATTILSVCEEIVKNQYDFFEKGVQFLRPMQLKDIAEAAEIHESTVSRVTNNKYMHTPRGLFELKYFFSGAAGSFSGDDSTSTTAIKHKIKTLIDQEESTNILSDDNIVELLAQQSIKIARRTIAKYRESMNIPTSAARKRIKRKVL
ncbi:MAG: RNA polymerase factor sigma-54 [Alphaproteobacteria bacterium]|nr:RNA polymerase factor sigma-54 [Alphaproteobacteria bacterium]